MSAKDNFNLDDPDASEKGKVEAVEPEEQVKTSVEC